ncbi:hypothetical protein PMI58_002753 [Salmonella enterica]|nr:hypothetical protein [Salmonella enterica subsp. diarizonae]EEG1121521.1 hypothetical protein [Salmonella enterica subsp. diarizonae]EGU4505591.1 hypothetical protein [Salmonella enterica]EKK4208800.1 hypothetical protein [Salmonella enterica]ELY5675698.1 hypothetical protein [Salmonella enterica]
MGNSNEAEKTTQTAAKDGPYINAGDMSLEEFTDWLDVKSAENRGFYADYSSTVDCICKEMQFLIDRLGEATPLLKDHEIYRSADHASEAQEALAFYTTLEKAGRDFLNTIEQLKATPGRRWWKGDRQEASTQE